MPPLVVPVLVVMQVIIMPVRAVSVMAMAVWARSWGVIVPMSIVDNDRCWPAGSCHRMRTVSRRAHLSRYK